MLSAVFDPAIGHTDAGPELGEPKPLPPTKDLLERACRFGFSQFEYMRDLHDDEEVYFNFAGRVGRVGLTAVLLSSGISELLSDRVWDSRTW